MDWNDTPKSSHHNSGISTASFMVEEETLFSYRYTKGYNLHNPR